MLQYLNQSIRYACARDVRSLMLFTIVAQSYTSHSSCVATRACVPVCVGLIDCLSQIAQDTNVDGFIDVWEALKSINGLDAALGGKIRGQPLDNEHWNGCVMSVALSTAALLVLLHACSRFPFFASRKHPASFANLRTCCMCDV
jgi:hypothetical protein